MNEFSDSAVVLMSIHPQYVKAIEDGNKLIEFRKRNFTKQVSHILVYETMPSKSVVGYFEVKGIEIGSPDEIWGKHSTNAGISKSDFFNYYGGSEIAVGILIHKYISLKQPIDIKTLKIFPPQSFKYISDELFAKIKEIGGESNA